MRIATIVISILCAIAAAVIVLKMLRSPDPDLVGLDVTLGWSVAFLGLVTAMPALLLSLRSQWQKTALAFALAFPVGLGVLIGYFYVTYFM